MTSILTNSSALAALQTLRSINSNLADTQSHVNSGLRVAVAADNAAYWSISTTMRSDNMAISAISDALGIGAAKVDTAYAGMEAVVNVLAEVKAKIVAATEDGVDKHKIQEELEQYKQQVLSIAESASFNGVNWLSSGEVSASVVSSFVRTEDGSVSVKTVDIDLDAISLFTAVGNGLLDSGKPIQIDDLANLDETGSGGAWLLKFPFSSPLTFDDDTTVISFRVTVDDDDPNYIPNPQPGVSTDVTIDRTLVDAVLGSGGIVSTEGEWIQVLNAALSGTGANATDWPFTNEFHIGTSHTSGARGSHVALSNVQSTLTSGLTGGLVNDSSNYGSPASASFEFTTPFTLGEKAEVSLNLTVDGKTYEVLINQTTIDQALGKNATVSTIQQYADVLNEAFADANSGYNAEVTTGWSDGIDRVTISGDPSVHQTAGFNSQLEFRFVNADWGIGLVDIDVTGSATVGLDAMLRAIERMTKQTTSAAAKLGSLQSRIDMQTEFANILMDSIDRGIGRMVDVDMNEASTRLKALQTQQQLSIQALNIANSASEGVLQLFR